MPAPPPNQERAPNPGGLMRSLGRFTGHLWQAVRADPARDRSEVRREVEETESELPDGRRVTLRRTTIEEVEVHPDP